MNSELWTGFALSDEAGEDLVRGEEEITGYFQHIPLLLEQVRIEEVVDGPLHTPGWVPQFIPHAGKGNAIGESEPHDQALLPCCGDVGLQSLGPRKLSSRYGSYVLPEICVISVSETPRPPLTFPVA